MDCLLIRQLLSKNRQALSMQRLLVSIEDAKDVDGMSGIINGKSDQIGKPLHGLTADVFISDSRCGREFSNAVKILGHQVSEPVAQISSQSVIILDRYCDIFGGSR